MLFYSLMMSSNAHFYPLVLLFHREQKREPSLRTILSKSCVWIFVYFFLSFSTKNRNSIIKFFLFCHRNFDSMERTITLECTFSSEWLFVAFSCITKINYLFQLFDPIKTGSLQEYTYYINLAVLIDRLKYCPLVLFIDKSTLIDLIILGDMSLLNDVEHL